VSPHSLSRKKKYDERCILVWAAAAASCCSSLTVLESVLEYTVIVRPFFREKNFSFSIICLGSTTNFLSAESYGL
jgi:hypothetical protein